MLVGKRGCRPAWKNAHRPDNRDDHHGLRPVARSKKGRGNYARPS